MNSAMKPVIGAPVAGRLTELDWVRIGAFGLLILYHVGMFYVPWDWHVKSPHPVVWLEELMALSSPWRLSLLFVVSGAATALLTERAEARTASGGTGGGSLAAQRSRRLLWPLLFGIVVIVPPQSYLEVVEKLGYAGSYGQFLWRYFHADHSFCRGTDCLVLPTWNHLWFVAYLWVYTMLALLLLRVLRRGGGRRWFTAPGWRQITAGARLLWVPWLFFALLRQQLVGLFPTTHDLVGDWYNHALYMSMFVLGWALFGQRDDRHGAWAAAARLRWWALGAALLAHAVTRSVWGPWDGDTPISDATLMELRAVNALRQWAPIIAVLGFARLHLAGRDGPLREALTEAVFPFYIVHQTLIVVAAHNMARLGWPQPLEAAVLVLVTVGGCVGTYLIVRRVAWLRPLFGLAKVPLPARSSQTPDTRRLASR